MSGLGLFLGAGAAAVAAMVFTPVAARVARWAGLIDRPDGSALKIHEAPVPLSGGPAVFVATLIGAAVAGWRPPPIVVIAVALGLALGIGDDARSLPIRYRVAGLAAIGLLLALNVDGSLPLAIVTVGLAVAVPNGVNLVDGQDGLAASVSIASALGLTLALAATDHVAAATGAGLVGALLGFLLWNRPPARVFLGDGGAYAVGIILTWLIAELIALEGWPGLVASALCVVVLAVEVTSTLLRRWTQHRPVTQGDRDHLYDRLARRLGRRGSLAVFSAAAAAGAASGAYVAVHL
jgi:UDP-GlcNAc:undecaprenyl-phosphate GlcNAc-1-phosphate transferase